MNGRIVGFVVQSNTAQQVELRPVGLNGMETRAASEYSPEMKVLELVIFVVVEYRHESAAVDIAVIRPARAPRLSSHAHGLAYQSLGVNLIEVHGEFIVVGDAGSVQRVGDRQRTGVA